MGFKMDISTIIGILGGGVVLLIVMLLSGPLLMFWDTLSLLIVMGGAFFSVMMRWPMKNFINGWKASVVTIKGGSMETQKLIDEILELAQVARKGSVLALEKVPIEDKYLAKAIRLMVDGNDPSVINDILDVDISRMKQRHKDGRGVLENMGDATPAFGMIGTVIGLVVIMANLTDPSKIGPGLAVALVTTLYGSLMANVFFIPMSQKLEYRSKNEITNMFVIREGINSIVNGENPRVVQEKLESYL
jgi:chemotaxis protein MotA